MPRKSEGGPPVLTASFFFLALVIGLPIAGIVFVIGLGGLLVFFGTQAPRLADPVDPPAPQIVANKPPGIEPAPQPAEAWANAPKESVRVGDFEISVSKITLGKPRLTNLFTDRDFDSPTSYLMVFFDLKNLSETKKLNHPGWARSGYIGHRFKLTDEFGNEYLPRRLDYRKVDGVALPYESIYPGKTSSDIAAFEPPVERAKQFKLTLPIPDNPNLARFTFPASVIWSKLEN